MQLAGAIARGQQQPEARVARRRDFLLHRLDTRAEGALRATLGHLFALAEAYPDLKTNQSFQQLQARISGLENGIADRREFYNESVNVNNVRIEQFPDTIIAGMFNFKPAHLLEFREAEKADVDMKQLFGS